MYSKLAHKIIQRQQYFKNGDVRFPERWLIMWFVSSLIQKPSETATSSTNIVILAEQILRILAVAVVSKEFNWFSILVHDMTIVTLKSYSLSLFGYIHMACIPLFTYA